MSSIKPRTVPPVIVYDGDDLARMAELRAAVERAERGNRVDDDDEIQARKDEFNAFVMEASERATEIHLQSIGGFQFMDLMSENPPREGNDEDEMFGVNVRAFSQALLTFDKDGRRTIREPRFDSPRDAEEFVASLDVGILDECWQLAYFLNRGRSQDPKEVLYSDERETSTETSTSPDRLA